MKGFVEKLDGATVRAIVSLGREFLLLIATIISLIVVWRFACHLSTGPAGRFEAVLFAAALGTLAIVVVRLADASDQADQARRRGRAPSYAGVWLTTFALTIGGVTAADVLRRIPKELESPWLRGAQSLAPADPRCAVLRNPEATPVAIAAARQAGCQ